MRGLQSVLGSRAMIERRRTWRERLLTRPWRPFMVWTPHVPLGRVEGVRVTQGGCGVEFKVAFVEPANGVEGFAVTPIKDRPPLSLGYALTMLDEHGNAHAPEPWPDDEEDDGA